MTMKGILGRKVGMTQVYGDGGQVIPVTVVETGSCHVLQLRTPERDGYEAVQVGFIDKPRRLARRSERGHVARLNSKRSRKLATAGVESPPKPDCEPKRFVRELRGSSEGFEIGQALSVDMFRPTLSDLPEMLVELAKASGIDTAKVGWQYELERKKADKFHETVSSVVSVDITGISKGRGYQGVMKRHGFSGQRATHGVKKVHRHPGGTGCSADPSRTIKGRRMAGQHGNARVTVRNVKVVSVDVENSLILLRGAVPGPNGGYVVIRESNKVG
jgi:large subunit ribosomal protein L3